MSLLKAIRAQLGLSVTPANNFTWDSSADNGTMKLARGNAGATTQDILTVDAAGKVAFPVGVTNGIVAWAKAQSSPASLLAGVNIASYTRPATGDHRFTFTTPLADGNYSVVATSVYTGLSVIAQIYSQNANGFTIVTSTDAAVAFNPTFLNVMVVR